MATTSARPDLLRHLAEALTTGAARASRPLDEAAEALRRYDLTCPHGGAAPRPDLVADGRLGEVRALAATVGHLARAFDAADRGDPGLAVASDVAIADHLVAHHPGSAVAGLLRPRRDLDARAGRLGERLRTLVARGHLEAAETILDRLTPEVLDDPSAAAALFSGLTPGELVTLVDHLADRSLGWRRPSRALRLLGRLHSTASRSWEPGHRGVRLDGDLVRRLAAHDADADALRLLLAVTERPAGPTYLRHLLGPLLLDAGPDPGGSSGAARALAGLDGAEDRDAGVLRAIAGNPAVAADLVRGPVAGHPRALRVAQLFELADGAAQDELAAVLRVALAEPALAGPDDATERWLLLNDVVEAAGADPGAVREPLATWLAETTFDDPAYWETRASPSLDDDRARLVSAMEAIASHGRSFATAVTGLEVRERRCLAGAVAESPTCDLDELRGIDDVRAVLREGAARADLPGDPWGDAFLVADAGLDLGLGAVPMGRVAGLVVRPAVDAGMQRLREQTRPDPGRRAGVVDAQQVRRRRNAWLAVAGAPPHRGAIRWQRHGPGTIDDRSALRRLAADADGQVALAAWEARQPPGLRALVDRLAGP